MTSDELLKAATGALRRFGDEQQNGDATRARVLAGLAARKRRRRAFGTTLLVLVLALTASTVWASASGRLPAIWNAAVELVKPAAPRPRARAHEAKPVVVAPPAPVVTPPAPVVVTPPAPVVVAPPARVHHHATKAPEIDDDDADVRAETDLFKVAHQAHFVTRDPAAALVAWDRYLSAAPAGRYALEAKWGRALCLVRLGHHDEAVAALQFFADGVHGDYRRREAQQLMDALAHNAQ
jgi:hypothetical protein